MLYWMFICIGENLQTQKLPITEKINSQCYTQKRKGGEQNDSLSSVKKLIECVL